MNMQMCAFLRESIAFIRFSQLVMMKPISTPNLKGLHEKKNDVNQRMKLHV